jgi:uncharacterized membrane protein
MQSFISNFLKGILILGPLGLTAYVIWFVFVKVDSFLRIPIPGVGFAVTILVIVMVGALASNIFFERVWNHFEKVMTRLPVVKLLYFSIKDFINAFVGEKKSFSRPVMISLGPGWLPGLAPSQPAIAGAVTAGAAPGVLVENLPAPASGAGGDDLKLLGFVTSDSLDLPGVEDRVAVYLPQSYNFGGMLVLIPKDRITPLATADSAKIMAFIVSGGVSRGAA